MQSITKIALASVVTLVAGLGFLVAGWGAFSRGFFYISRHSILVIRQQESPFAFYAGVTFMLFGGVLLLTAGVAFGLSRRKLRNEVISFVDSAVISRPGPRWLLIVLAVLVVALLASVPLFVI